MMCMTYLMMKDVKRPGNGHVARYMQDIRQTLSVPGVLESMLLELLGISGYSLALTFN